MKSNKINVKVPISYDSEFLMYLRVLRLPAYIEDSPYVISNLESNKFISFFNEIGAIQDYVQMLANTILSKSLKYNDIMMLEKIESQLNEATDPDTIQHLSNLAAALEASISEKNMVGLAFTQIEI